MATKKVNVEVDVETNAQGSIKQLRELRRELQGAAAGSDEFKKISAEIRNVEDSLKNAALEANDFRGALESAPGPVGQLFAGIKKVEIATKSWGAALKATGIGLIVAAVAGLVMAFREQEDIMKKMEPILIAFEQIFNGIFDVIEPLLDAFLDLALDALPFLTKGLGAFYSVLAGFFQLVKDFGVGVGNILKGIFTLDFSAIKEGFDTLKGAIPAAIEAGLDAFERFEEGSKRQTSTERQNAEERNKIREEETRKLEEELRKRQEAQRKADEIFLLNFEDEQRELTMALLRKIEREKALQEAGYEDLTVADELYRKEVQAIAEKYDKIDEDRQRRIRNLNLLTLDGEEKELQEALIRKQDRERELKELGYEDLSVAEELYQQEIQAIQQKYTDQELERRRLDAEAILEIERMKSDGIIEINQSTIDAVTGFGILLQQAAMKNKSLQIAGVIIEQAASIARIVQATNIANAATVARWALIPGGPAIAARQVALNNISAGLGIASSVAAGARAISQIRGVSFDSPAGGGAVARPPAYTPRTTTERPTPTIGPATGLDATAQIARTLQGITDRPLQAFVVSTDVSSQQALDRRTNRAATFS